ncbi:ABC transporter permease [Schaalia suimastitidis]|uniref:ABC transporter permease n=1 Tax=Schaalia suimastitidis TaxID=121163 RepID=UPI00040A6B5F|nr:ABC transporter permease [Schaalia suimastitidis]
MALKQVMSRIAQSAGVMLVLSFIVFSLLHLVPGDIVKTLVGTRRVTDEVRQAITDKYNLDDPFLIQYAKWLANALTGDLGTSIRTNAPVVDTITQRVGVTALLTLIAFIVAMCVGIVLGVVAAHRIGSRTDRTIVGWAVVGISAPGFALGLILLYVFSVMLGWFPIFGIGRGGADLAWHLTLPGIALAVGTCALIIRITRAAVAHELEQDYVTFARSRGIDRRRIRRMYLKNASIPIITSAGLVLGSLFGSTVLVEQTFSLPGLGQLLADSITFKDVPVVQAIVLLVAGVIVAVTLVVDLLVLAIDPTAHARQGVQ